MQLKTIEIKLDELSPEVEQGVNGLDLLVNEVINWNTDNNIVFISVMTDKEDFAILKIANALLDGVEAKVYPGIPRIADNVYNQ